MTFCTKHETYPLFETCPLCELKTIREALGEVYANVGHKEGRADQILIEMGMIAGDGLLGVVVEAVQELESESGWCGYYSSDALRLVDAEAGRKAAWVDLFVALKAIEEA